MEHLASLGIFFAGLGVFLLSCGFFGADFAVRKNQKVILLVYLNTIPKSD